MTSATVDATPSGETTGGSAVVLIGPMGAGKTSVGRKLARVLGTTFFDTDIASICLLSCASRDMLSGPTIKRPLPE